MQYNSTSAAAGCGHQVAAHRQVAHWMARHIRLPAQYYQSARRGSVRWIPFSTASAASSSCLSKPPARRGDAAALFGSAASPMHLAELPGRGRGLVASRRISPGETVLSEVPLASCDSFSFQSHALLSHSLLSLTLSLVSLSRQSHSFLGIIFYQSCL